MLVAWPVLLRSRVVNSDVGTGCSISAAVSFVGALVMWAEGCWMRSELGSEAQVSGTKRKATPTVTNGKA